MGTEAECQGKEDFSLQSPMCLPVRRQKQAEYLQKVLQYIQLHGGFWFCGVAGGGDADGWAPTEYSWIYGA